MMALSGLQEIHERLHLRARGLSDEASRVFPVNHSMSSSNYNLSEVPKRLIISYLKSAGQFFTQNIQSDRLYRPS